MATVYLATQESLDRPVSIKVMSGDGLADEIARQRFENEARTIARLSHPNIVAIHEVGRTEDGRMYYVMPYLPNGDLGQRDLRGDGVRVAEILRALLAALGYAHARGIVHRDVKRENVLFDGDDRPMLTDFGIAQVRSGDTRLTTVGHAVGSTSYMSPEQARGDVVDGRTDLYAVGVLAYELLVGRLPFQATDALAMAVMHAQDPIPRLPAELRQWQSFIDKAMAKARDGRFANAQEMMQALEAIGHRQGNRTGQVAQAVSGDGAGRRWALVVVGIGIVVIVAAAFWMRHSDGSAMTPAPAGPVVASAEPAASMMASNSGVAQASPAVAADSASGTASTVGAPASNPSEGSVSAASASSSGAADDARDRAASGSTSKAQSSGQHPKRPRQRRVKKRNFISRWWHDL